MKKSQNYFFLLSEKVVVNYQGFGNNVMFVTEKCNIHLFEVNLVLCEAISSPVTTSLLHESAGLMLSRTMRRNNLKHVL